MSNCSNSGRQLGLFTPSDFGEAMPHGAPTLTRLAASDADFAQLLTEIESAQRFMRDVSLDRVAPYAAADADATWRLARLLRPQVDNLGLHQLLDEVEFPMLPVLVDMEMAGIDAELIVFDAMPHAHG